MNEWMNDEEKWQIFSRVECQIINAERTIEEENHLAIITVISNPDKDINAHDTFGWVRCCTGGLHIFDEILHKIFNN